MNPDKTLNSFEQELETIYNTVEPDTAFMATLQSKLKNAKLDTPGMIKPRFNWRWGLAAAMVLLVMISILAIGPKQVWAMANYWLSGGTGFNPKIGFAPVGATLELAEPVEIKRGSAVFRMGDVLFMAGRETTLNYSIQLSPDIYEELTKYPVPTPGINTTFEESMAPYQFETFKNWIQTPEDQKMSTHGGMVYLQDGQLLSFQAYVEPGQDLYTHYELVLPAKLTAMIGAGEGDWVIPFDLKVVEMIQPEPTQDSSSGTSGTDINGVTSETVTEKPLSDQQGAVYQPTAPPVENHQIEIMISDVAITANETAIRLKLNDKNINLQTAGFDAEKIHLEDENGYVYSQIEKFAANDNPSQRTLFFEALKPGVKHLRLTVDGLNVVEMAWSSCPVDNPNCQNKGLDYRLESENPITAGDVFTPKIGLELPNFPGSKLLLEEAQINAGDAAQGSGLVVTVKWQFDLPYSMKLVGVSSNINFKEGETVQGCGGVSHSGVPIGDHEIQETYIVRQEEMLSSFQKMYVNVCQWEVELSGPWVVNWEIPQK